MHIIYFKHNAFKSENEVRIIVHAPNGKTLDEVAIIWKKNTHCRKIQE